MFFFQQVKFLMSRSGLQMHKNCPLFQHDFWSGVGCLHTTPSMFGKFVVHAWRVVWTIE